MPSAHRLSNVRFGYAYWNATALNMAWRTDSSCFKTRPHTLHG